MKSKNENQNNVANGAELNANCDNKAALSAKSTQNVYVNLNGIGCCPYSTKDATKAESANSSHRHKIRSSQLVKSKYSDYYSWDEAKKAALMLGIYDPEIYHHAFDRIKNRDSKVTISEWMIYLQRQNRIY